MRAPELDEALRSLNQTSAIDWAAQSPTASFVEMARRLPGGIAPLALQKELLREARERGEFPLLVRGVLVRLLNSEFPRGLGTQTGEDADSNLSSVFSMWSASFDPDQRSAAEAIWAKVADAMKASPDWVPQQADEPKLLKLFAGYDLERSKRAGLVAAARARIDARLAGRTTNRERLAAISELPPGYRWMYATSWVDTSIRNGGLQTVYNTGGGIEVPLAIEGLRAMKAEDLATLIEESLAFGRASQREKLGPGLFTDPPIAAFPTPRTWTQIDRAYCAHAPDLFERFASLLESMPELFEPPFRQLRNAEDGRKWKVRTSGVVVEIQIELADGTLITRERRCTSNETAEIEALALINEQLQDGFSEAN